MIVIRLMGGLGNQIFQYAIGRELETRGKAVFFDRSIVDACTARTYLLDDFQTNVRFTDKIEAEVVEQSMPFNPRVLSADNCTLTGYWQCEKYFPGVARELRNELVPTRLSSESIELSRQIDENSIALHVRRSDSLSQRAMPYHGLLSVRDYYSQAIDYVLRRVANPHFYIFSDDIPWCRQNLKLPLMTFVTHNPMSGVCDANGIITKGIRGRECEDIWLMSLCQHAIIANSTFSWWGAWLGEPKKDRIVVAPKQWFVDPKMDARDIVPLRWMTI